MYIYHRAFFCEKLSRCNSNYIPKGHIYYHSESLYVLTKCTGVYYPGVVRRLRSYVDFEYSLALMYTYLLKFSLETEHL